MKNKGFLNKVSQNIINGDIIDNQSKFWKIVNNETESVTVDYLLNYQYQDLASIKSISMFNSSGLALDINAESKRKEIINENTIYLDPKYKRGNLQKLLLKRKSVRKYQNKEMTLRELSSILHYSFGVKGNVEIAGRNIYSRFHSSSGGLYAVEVIIYVNNVKDVDKGFYKYQPVSNTLHLLKVDSTKEVENCFSNNVIDVGNSNIIVFFFNSLENIYLKYGELSLSLMFIETGIMSQNLHINSLNYGYGSCDIGGFNKKGVEKMLGFNGVTENIIYAVSVGKEKYDI